MMTGKDVMSSRRDRPESSCGFDGSVRFVVPETVDTAYLDLVKRMRCNFLKGFADISLPSRFITHEFTTRLQKIKE